MKTKILAILSVVFVILLSCCIVSCGNDGENYTQIITQNATYENGTYKITVEPSVTSYDITTIFSVQEEAHYELSRNENFAELMENGTITLEPGNNIFFVRVTDKNKNSTVYKFNVYQKKMITVTFDSNGGTVVEPVQVVEGTTIVPPESLKMGHSLVWEGYDFSQPINKDVTVTAKWTPNEYKIKIDAPDTDKDGEEIVVKYGELFESKIPDVSKVGYTFVSWKYNEVEINQNSTFTYTNDITVRAYFQPIKYSVSYIAQPGAQIPENMPFEFTIEDIISLEELDAIWLGTDDCPSDEKTFAGWYLTTDFTEESKITEIKETADNIVLYAKFDDVIFTSKVTLVFGDVTFDTCEFTYKQPYTLPDYTVDEHHIFHGWKDGENNVPSEGAAWGYKTDITLIANVEGRVYDIEYVLGNGVVNNPENPSTFTADSEPFTLLNPTFSIHDFEGWYTDSTWTTKVEQILPTDAGKKITLYPKWTYKYKVTLNADGGVCELDEIIFKYNQPYEIPSVTKDYFTFDGWYYGDTPLASAGSVWSYDSDIEIVAKWTPVKYTINYVLNGAEIDASHPTTYTVVSGIGELLPPSILPENTLFEGWFLDARYEQPFDGSADWHENITLYAKITRKTTTITYDANGGTSESSQVVNFNSNYSLITPIRPGYEFLGWLDNEEKIEQNGIWTKDVRQMTLIAQWSKIKYTIKYENAEVSGPTEYYVDSDNISLPIPSNEGFIFEGWVVDGAKPSRNIVISKGSTGDRTYYASWIKATDEDTGFTYDLVDGAMVVVKFYRHIDTNKNSFNDIYIPSEYAGYKVCTIGAGAFEQFGKDFQVTKFANSGFKFVTIHIPSTVNHIGANAFKTCNGLTVKVYGTDDYEFWDSTVSWETGNSEARDCLFGLRPAIGWTKFSNKK